MADTTVYEKKEVKKRSENLSDWYNDIVLKAELADYGPSKGSMVIRPYGFAIWERVQSEFNTYMKEAGVENGYFPLLIPYSLINREKDHIEGFSPELAIVTKAGGEDLAEPLVVRPTSETVMYEMYSKWIKSWRDLPMKINQWNNVVRWEKRTYLFLRTSEFLWQEGHTAHADEGEAIDMALLALEWYRRVYEELYAIPVLLGIKSEQEKFAGAKTTYTAEALMPDGKALQGATSHNLAQNFSKPFNIKFQNRESKEDHVWQTSWGLSTRSMGGLFLTHGDDNGLIMPPRIAPKQVVIIPIYKSEEDKAKIAAFVDDIETHLSRANVRVHIDDREGQSVGRKFNEWEVKGVPLRFEVGEQEASKNVVTAVRRDDGEKLVINRDNLVEEVQSLLEGIQAGMYEKASSYLAQNTHETKDYEEFKKIMTTTKGFIRAFWCEDPACENQIKEETKATTRLRRMDGEELDGVCIKCGKKATHIWYFAQAY